MSIEVTLFLLRLLSGLILAGFLLALFYIIWRSFLQETDALEYQQPHYARLAAIDNQTGEHRLDKSFALLPTTTLGSSASNAIVVDGDHASALHASIVFEGDRWWLQDCASRHGTLLNGQTVKQRTALSDGDEIRIGRRAYRLMMPKHVSTSHQSQV